MCNNNLAAPNFPLKKPTWWKACREFRYKNNRTTKAIGVILAFTGKKMFYFNQKSEVPLTNFKTNRGPC
jgi:hypothetical protein